MTPSAQEPLKGADAWRCPGHQLAGSTTSSWITIKRMLANRNARAGSGRTAPEVPPVGWAKGAAGEAVGGDFEELRGDVGGLVGGRRWSR
jgi:hypothetical protein